MRENAFLIPNLVITLHAQDSTLESQHILHDIRGLTVDDVYCCRRKQEEIILKTKQIGSQV